MKNMSAMFSCSINRNNSFISSAYQKLVDFQLNLAQFLQIGGLFLDKKIAKAPEMWKKMKMFIYSFGAKIITV